ncbi:MAG: sigma-70 family RNA polymerase sigma factor [Acetobacteraceae bacterium]|nr:sigma-70 family RNA polymerase sigma factor [Acetobacteraceae bacterium]
MALTDVVQHCAAGDADALRQLYDLQSARLYGIALRITRQPELAAGAVHDAFVSIWQFASTFDPARSSAEAWLTSIIRYRALDAARRNYMDSAEDEKISVDPDPPAPPRTSADTVPLQRCFRELEPENRRILSLAFLDGLTEDQLARLLKLPLGTIKSGLRSGLADLRRCLEP